MASKRSIRRKQCGHKQRFADSASARAVMLQVIYSKNFNGGRMNVYRCRFCAGYHFGHAPGRPS